jgi:hypothetical protein
LCPLKKKKNTVQRKRGRGREGEREIEGEREGGEIEGKRERKKRLLARLHPNLMVSMC